MANGFFRNVLNNVRDASTDPEKKAASVSAANAAEKEKAPKLPGTEALPLSGKEEQAKPQIPIARPTAVQQPSAQASLSGSAPKPMAGTISRKPEKPAEPEKSKAPEAATAPEFTAGYAPLYGNRVTPEDLAPFQSTVSGVYNMFNGMFPGAARKNTAVNPKSPVNANPALFASNGAGAAADYLDSLPESAAPGDPASGETAAEQASEEEAENGESPSSEAAKDDFTSLFLDYMGNAGLDYDDIGNFVFNGDESEWRNFVSDPTILPYYADDFADGAVTDEAWSKFWETYKPRTLEDVYADALYYEQFGTDAPAIQSITDYATANYDYGYADPSGSGVLAGIDPEYQSALLQYEILKNMANLYRDNHGGVGDAGFLSDVFSQDEINLLAGLDSMMLVDEGTEGAKALADWYADSSADDYRDTTFDVDLYNQYKVPTEGMWQAIREAAGPEANLYYASNPNYTA